MINVGILSEADVEAVCHRLLQVGAFANRAASAAGLVSQYPSMAVYGTNVHVRFKDYVDDLRENNFRAERSFLKEKCDPTSNEDLRYGYPGSIRVDGYELRPDGTLCVYDLKTGRAGVSLRRAEILANAARMGFDNIRRVVVIEVRPRR